MTKEKKSILIAIVLFFASINNYTYSMEDTRSKRLEKRAKKRIKKTSARSFTMRATQVIKGEKPITMFFDKEPIDCFDFNSLSSDLQQYIVRCVCAKNLKKTIKTLLTFACVNKELNSYIYSTTFTNTIITSCSKRFNIAPLAVASYINTFASKKYLTTWLFSITEEMNDEIASLKDDTINVNLRDENGNTLLINAVEANQSNIIDSLLHNPKLRINARNNAGDTALHIVFHKAMTTDDIIEKIDCTGLGIKLLCHKADPEVLNNYGITPAHLAIQINDPSLTQQVGYAKARKVILNNGI